MGQLLQLHRCPFLNFSQKIFFPDEVYLKIGGYNKQNGKRSDPSVPKKNLFFSLASLAIAVFAVRKIHN